jgi:hypothetical protein
MASAWEASVAELRAEATRCEALREGGNELFRTGAHADASDAYAATAAAAEALAARADALPAGASVVRAELALVTAQLRAAALNNRAACWLKLQLPLRVLADTADAMAVCCERGSRTWQRALLAPPWAHAFYVKAIHRRAVAFQALGQPLGALADTHYRCRNRAGAAQPGELAALTYSLLEVDEAAPPNGDAVAAADAAPLRGRCSRVAVDAAAPTPPTRRLAAYAALDGQLYVYGGQSTDGWCLGILGSPPLDDFWRLPLGCARNAAPVAWERLPRLPGGASSDGFGPLAAAAHARSELALLACGAVWAFAAGARAWRRVAPAAALRGRRGAAAAALVAHADHALALTFDGIAPCVRRVHLRTGDAVAIALAPGPCPAPRLLAHAWVDDADGAPPRLMLYGGMEECGHEGVPGHPQVAACHSTTVALDDVWALPLPTDAAAPPAQWALLPHLGGGVPPPPRAEAAFAPLPGAAGALLFGGYGELLPSFDAATQRGVGYRYMADAHVYDAARRGWRPVRWDAPAGGAACRPPRRAQALAAAATMPAPSGGGCAACVVLVGGYAVVGVGAEPTAAPLNEDVWLLRISDDDSDRDDGAGASDTDVWAALRTAAPPLADWPPGVAETVRPVTAHIARQPPVATTGFEALLRRAAAAPREPAATGSLPGAAHSAALAATRTSASS